MLQDLPARIAAAQSQQDINTIYTVIADVKEKLASKSKQKRKCWID